jgi:hypothetical protein
MLMGGACAKTYGLATEERLVSPRHNCSIPSS